MMMMMIMCSRERKFQGAKVPGSESSTPGTFAPRSEWSWERKVHNSFKSRLDKFWQHQDMIYDFQAELNGTGSRSLPASLKLDGTTERPTEQQLANIWGETGHSRLIITR